MAHLKPLLLTALVAAGNVAAAQEQDSVLAKPPARAKELLPIEVRSLRAGSNSPFVKTDISGRAIEEQNLGQDLPMMLQQTASAVVTSDAGAGVGYTGLRVRGTDGTRINVTLNGIPVNDAESQGAFFVDLPDLASSTSSIQLQRGVGTSTNGAGAFGATLSISNMEQLLHPGAEVYISGGSFNTQRYTLRAGTGLMDNGWQFDVRLSKISSDGYVQRSSSDLKSLQFLAAYQASEKTRFRFQVLSGTEKTGQAWNGVPQDSLGTNRRYNELGLKPDGTHYDNQTDNYIQSYYQAFVDHNFNSRWSGHAGLFLTRGKGYYEEYRMGESFSSYGLPDFVRAAGDTVTKTDMIRQLWLDNYYYGGIYSLNYATEKTQVTFGGAWTQYEGHHYGDVTWAQYDVPDHYQWYRLDAQKNDLNVYVKAQQAIGSKLTVFADVQYRNVAYFMNGFRKNPDLKPDVNYNFFNPKAGINYSLRNTPRNMQRLYASIAMANKEPNRDDFEASPQSLPKPEQLTDIEAGYEIRKKKWNVSANLFYMQYKDQLVLTGRINDVGAYARANVASSYRMGIELQGAVKLRKWVEVQGNITGSQNKIKDFTEYIDNWDDGGQNTVQHGTTDIAFSPNLVGAFDIKFLPFKRFRNSEGKRIEFDVLGKHVGRQYLDNTSDRQRSIADYTLIDLRARYVIQMKGMRELALTLAVNNIFDRMYESNGYNYSYISGGAVNVSNYYFPQAGTNVLAGVNLKF